MASRQDPADEYLDWSKQGLEEIKATLAGLADYAEGLTADARKQANLATARIRAARGALEPMIDAILPDVTPAKAITENVYADTAADWTKSNSRCKTFLPSRRAKRPT